MSSYVWPISWPMNGLQVFLINFYLFIIYFSMDGNLKLFKKQDETMVFQVLLPYTKLPTYLPTYLP
jgi:hypothetical protein